MIYVHVPFCRSKCAYCDFYSLPRIELAERYCDTLEAEWEWRREETEGLQSRPTLYIGGGTPSALPRRLLQRILTLLATPDMTEITVEVNPEDVDSEFIRWISDTPVSRISMGIQSLCDEELITVGRRHTAADALKALDLLTASRLDVSADLIYGLPGQTAASFASSLAEVTSRRPEHLSCYLLSYEPGTRLHAMRDRGRVREATDTEATGMFDMLRRLTAEAGYDHYEISNFALPGHRAIHNSGYWDLSPYIGLGPGAHSFDGRTRRYNPSDIKSYLESGGKGFAIAEEENADERINDYLIIRLRTAEGIDRGEFSRLFGCRPAQRLLDEAAPHIAAGRLIATDTSIRMNPDHWLVTDMVLTDLIQA